MTDIDETTPATAATGTRPRSLLAATTIHLMTPTTLARGLALVGVHWSVTEDPVDNEHGLYAWVSGQAGTPPLRSGVLYIGIANGRGGLKRRTGFEESGRGGDHAHGLAIKRNLARVVVGGVTHEVADLTWVRDLIADDEMAPRAEQIITDWCAAPSLNAIEEVAIRLAIHLGDTGAAVNSSHAGGWANDRPGDWVAFAIAQELTRRA